MTITKMIQNKLNQKTNASDSDESTMVYTKRQ